MRRARPIVFSSSPKSWNDEGAELWRCPMIAARLMFSGEHWRPDLVPPPSRTVVVAHSERKPRDPEEVTFELSHRILDCAPDDEIMGSR
jgi:hypothetical protein